MRLYFIFDFNRFYCIFYNICERLANLPSVTNNFANGHAVVKIEVNIRMRDFLEEKGMARDIGVFLSGVSALAVPIFDHQGNVAAVMTALGRESSFDVGWDAPAARALKSAADLVSRQLGYRGAP